MWTLPSVAAQSRQTFALLLLAPPGTVPGQSNRMPFTATLTATAPDEALLRASETKVGLLQGIRVNDVQAQPGILLAYLTGS